MKKLLVILAITSIVFGCNSSDNGEKKAPEQKAADTPASNGQPTVANEKGLELIGANDCTTCHQIDKKVLGPSYKEVAKKYKGDAKAPDDLFAKVRAGGAKVWGPIPMPPNPKEKISDDDLKLLVGWILAL